MDTFNISSLIEDSLDTDSEVMFRKPSATETIKHKKITADNMRTYMQGTLPTSVAANSEELSNLKDGSTPFEAISLSSGRKAFHELTSNADLQSGWITIGFIAGNERDANSASFTVVSNERESSLKFEVAFMPSTAAKTHENNTIKIISKSNDFTSGFSTAGIVGCRLAKSDSVISAGAKIQVNLQTGATTERIEVQIAQNKGYDDSLGFQLVTPYLDNTPTLPDGVTVGTFLVAGEELDLSLTNAPLSGVLAMTKVSNSSVDCLAIWPEIPYQGTGLTFAVGSLVVRDSVGGVATISNANSISNVTILGKLVSFRLSEGTIFSGLSVGALRPVLTSGTCVLTIT